MYFIFMQILMIAYSSGLGNLQNAVIKNYSK